MRVGLIGCGNIGLRGHLHAYQSLPDVQVAALADVTPTRLEMAAEVAGLDPRNCYTDYRALLARDDIDFVDVTTPPHTHPAIVIAAAEAGKHILCEKPIATTPQDAEAMIAAARHSGVKLGLVHNYLFLPEIVVARQIIDEGTIGKVEFVTINALGVEDRPGAAEYRPTWRHDPTYAGGGVLMDMLHEVYLISWLLSQGDIVRVSAAIDRRRDSQGAVEDCAFCRFEYGSGYGVLNIAWGVGPGGIQITGTQGRIVIVYEGFGTGPFVPLERIYVWAAGQEHRPEVPKGGLKEVLSRFGLVIRDFVDSIRENRPPIAPAEEGRKALEGVLAAYKSAAIEQVVRLPLGSTDPVYQRGVAGLQELDIAPDNVLRRRHLFGLD